VNLHDVEVQQNFRPVDLQFSEKTDACPKSLHIHPQVNRLELTV